KKLFTSFILILVIISNKIVGIGLFSSCFVVITLNEWFSNRKNVRKTYESKLLVQDENIDEANLDDGLFVVTIPMIVNNNKCATSKIIICLYPVRINYINLFNHEYNIFHQLLSISNCTFKRIYESKTRFRTKKQTLLLLKGFVYLV